MMYGVGFERTTEIHAGRDQRPAGQGFSCAELLFILNDLAKPGAATLAMRTNWLPANMEHGFIRPSASLAFMDLTFHFPVPTLTAEQDKRDICPYIGGVCHSVTDRRNGPLLVNLLQASGSAAVWQQLEKLFTEEARINRPILKGDT